MGIDVGEDDESGEELENARFYTYFLVLILSVSSCKYVVLLCL